MKIVKIFKLQNDGSQTVLAIAKLINDQVELEGDQTFINNLKTTGINDYGDKTSNAKLFPQNGLKFLEQLGYNFKSGYLNASDIEDEN